MYKKLFTNFALLMLLTSCSFFTSSGLGTNKGVSEKVKITFYNSSSFKVDIYKNINPSNNDDSYSPLLTINPSESSSILQEPSIDQMVGDVFYIRYYVMLDNGENTNHSPIYVKARRDISNISFVIKANEPCTKTIEQPKKGQLQFSNAYLKIINTGKESFKVLNASSILKNMAQESISLASGKTGIYKLPFNEHISKNEIKHLKFRLQNLKEYEVPTFQIEKGKIYTFEYNGSSCNGPKINDISY